MLLSSEALTLLLANLDIKWKRSNSLQKSENFFCGELAYCLTWFVLVLTNNKITVVDCYSTYIRAFWPISTTFQIYFFEPVVWTPCRCQFWSTQFSKIVHKICRLRTRSQSKKAKFRFDTKMCAWCTGWNATTVNLLFLGSINKMLSFKRWRTIEIRWQPELKSKSWSSFCVRDHLYIT